jgi:SAM-dependent methyltransferase
MAMDTHVRLFDRIASGYRLFYGYQRRMFKPLIAENAHKIGAQKGDSFLDIGSGTGALVSVLSEAGFNAEGVDAAPGMVAAARRAGLKCELGDIGNGLPYRDGSFDFVISSFVAHGLVPELRVKLYSEALRIARKAVIIHDYHGKQPFTTELIERLEGGDFFRFVETAEAELAKAFDHLEIIEVTPSSAWYIGRSFAPE